MKNFHACFTGYRPMKYPWGFNENDIRCINMKKRLIVEIEKAIINGFHTFYCGMALGFDMICAEIIIDFKHKYSNIRLIAVLPCKNQDIKWQEKYKHKYKQILNKADEVYCMYEEYIGSKCMLERNYYMIDNSKLVISLYDGKEGGTKNTLDYEKKRV